jgi:hypothetical protein
MTTIGDVLSTMLPFLHHPADESPAEADGENVRSAAGLPRPGTTARHPETATRRGGRSVRRGA